MNYLQLRQQRKDTLRSRSDISLRSRFRKHTNWATFIHSNQRISADSQRWKEACDDCTKGRSIRQTPYHLKVECLHCGAPIGEPCTTKPGGYGYPSHPMNNGFVPAVHKKRHVLTSKVRTTAEILT